MRSALANKPSARVRGAIIATVFLMLAFLVGVAPASAWAEGEDANEVNTQQLPDSSFIYDTGIIELAGADGYFDNQTVQITGEAVGDCIKILEDPQHRWIDIASKNSASNASVATYMTEKSAELIDTFGKYGTTGTILQVRGTYHLACPQHEGLSDLHAEHVTVTERGKQHPDQFNAATYFPGIFVVVVGLLLLGVFYHLRERQR